MYYQFSEKFQVVHDDGLPPYLCASCLFRLMAAHSFRNQYIRSQSIMTNITSFDKSSTEPNKQHQEHDDNIFSASESPIKAELAANEDSTFDQEHKTIAEDKHDDETRHRCNVCLKTFKLKIALTKHKRTKHLNACPMCHKSSDNERAMRHHLMVEHFNKDEQLKCDECPVQSFTTVFELCTHLKLHRSKTPVQRSSSSATTHYNYKRIMVNCPVCKLEMVSKSLNRHMAAKHAQHPQQKPPDPEKQPAECKICNLKVLTRDLNRHMAHKHGIGDNRRTECKICNLNVLKVSLRRHMIYKHGSPGPKPRTWASNQKIICEICGVALSDASSMRAHMLTHSGERPFKCPICDKGFTTKFSMNEHHRNVHSEDKSKSFFCKQCPMTFRYKHSLKRHNFFSHTQEGRPFQCTVCSMKFITEPAMAKHLDMHERHANLHCHICERKYTSPSGLKHHYRREHKILKISLSVFGRGMTKNRTTMPQMNTTSITT